MNHNKRWGIGVISALFLGLATICLTATEAQAQQQLLAYSAKFVCGPWGNDLGPVVRGRYATTVNIHNPRFTTVSFRKKAVIALPQRSDRGPISQFVSETLIADAALGVDCRDIRALFPGVVLPAFIEGFVVLYTPVELDVVGVYTARHRTGTDTADPNKYDVESIDVEEVTPKRID